MKIVIPIFLFFIFPLTCLGSSEASEIDPKSWPIVRLTSNGISHYIVGTSHFDPLPSLPSEVLSSEIFYGEHRLSEPETIISLLKELYPETKDYNVIWGHAFLQSVREISSITFLKERGISTEASLLMGFMFYTHEQHGKTADEILEESFLEARKPVKYLEDSRILFDSFRLLKLSLFSEVLRDLLPRCSLTDSLDISGFLAPWRDILFMTSRIIRNKHMVQKWVDDRNTSSSLIAVGSNHLFHSHGMVALLMKAIPGATFELLDKPYDERSEARWTRITDQTGWVKTLQEVYPEEMFHSIIEGALKEEVLPAERMESLKQWAKSLCKITPDSERGIILEDLESTPHC